MDITRLDTKDVMRGHHCILYPRSMFPFRRKSQVSNLFRFRAMTLLKTKAPLLYRVATAASSHSTASAASSSLHPRTGSLRIVGAAADSAARRRGRPALALPPPSAPRVGGLSSSYASSWGGVVDRDGDVNGDEEGRGPVIKSPSRLLSLSKPGVTLWRGRGTTTSFSDAVVRTVSPGSPAGTGSRRSLSNSSSVGGNSDGGDGNESPKVSGSSNQSYSGPGLSKKARLLDPSILDAALQQPAGLLVDEYEEPLEDRTEDGRTTGIDVKTSRFFIPQVALHAGDGAGARKRVLVLCTGGTLTMAPDPEKGGALAPVEGAVTAYMREMRELHADNMPEVVAHEYSPFFDSSDMGPADWALLANDIKANYLHFDGFVVLMGTDTMAYAATALSFMLENLGKPVVFTGSQIPLCEPYNDARRNLIMALIFASRDTINEVGIFFHDRLLRACRATKVNTHRLMAFDSPNLDPLARIGISIDENEHLALPTVRGALRVHDRMDTRLLTIRLVPGFDDGIIRQMIEAGRELGTLRTLVLQLYGTGNIPSVKEDFINVLSDASDNGMLVVASTQCFTGSVMLGHYATGQALKRAGVVSANDMTLEAISCKCAYLFGRGDLSRDEVANLMGVSLRGEVTPAESLSPPPLSSAYQRASRKGKKYY